MSTLYSITRDALCTAAIEKLGVIARGQTPDSEDLTKAALNLKFLIAKFRTKGLFLWKRVEYDFNITDAVASYDIGVGKTLNTPYPLKMLSAYSMDTARNTVIPIDILAENEYNILPATASTGQPLKITYQPKLQYGTIRLWPTPNTAAASAYRVRVVYQAPFDFPETGTDTLDFPEEWYLPLVYELAVLLAPEWGIPLEDRRELKQEAKNITEEVNSFGSEDASLFFTPR